jgi:hypothetical protein
MSPLRALLGAYLRTSLRGKAAGTFFARRAGKWRGTVALIALYFTLGTVSALGASGSHNAFSYALVLHAVTFVMLGMSLAAESGDVLFNAADHDVLGCRPIDGRTLLIAKGASLYAFALLLGFAMNLPALFFASRIPALGPTFPVVHLGATALLALFVTSTVVFAYGLVIRFVGRNRFDSVAAWSQAALSGAFLVLSQGLAHIAELPILGLESRLCLVFVPAWFAALDVLGSAPRALMLGAFAAGTTTVLALLAFGRLAHAYGAASARLGEATALRSAATWTEDGWLARRWLRDPVERAAFRLATTYLRRDREIRTRLYPAFGFFVILPAAQLVGHAAYRFHAASIVAVLLLGMLPSLALEALRVSSQHAATELFAVAPLASAGPLFQGVRKAVACWIIMPAAAIALGWVAVLSPSTLPLAAPSVLMLPALSFLPATFRDYVPLSVPPAMGRQSTANVAIGMLITIMGGATIGIGAVAASSGHLPALVVAQIALGVPGCRLLARRIRNRPLLVS